MASRALLILALLAALGFAGWLLFEDGSGDFDPDAATRDETARPGPGDPGPIDAPRPDLEGPERDPNRPRVPRPHHPVVPTNQIARGGIDILPVDAEGRPIPSNDIRIDLQRHPPFWSQPGGVPDQNTGLWTFRNVVIGRLTIHVEGDHVLDPAEPALIRKDRIEYVRLPVEPAGAIRFKAVLYSGAVPESITLSLRLKGARLPIAARYQERSPTTLKAPKIAESVTIGPQGVIAGITPGSYVVRAVSAEGEIDEVEVEVEAGVTASVEVRLRF